jgi:nucleoside-diphosphate-sugar epimerase
VKALVVGAQGVIGRYIVEKLAGLPDWQVVGLSRRKGTDSARVRHVSVDLLNLKDELQDLTDITHIFYAAFQPAPGAAADYAKNIGANRAMLVNSISTIEKQSKTLERVVLVTGTKYYGSHLGPFRTPAKESDPRHLGPNYYFDQIDWLAAFQAGKRWTWTELRPQTLCGFAPGTAMSIIPVIAVYAAICKELGLPLRFPGKPGAFRAIYQGGNRGALREPGLQHHQRGLFPLVQCVAEDRAGVRHAGSRAPDHIAWRPYGRQGAAMGAYGA